MEGEGMQERCSRGLKGCLIAVACPSVGHTKGGAARDHVVTPPAARRWLVCAGGCSSSAEAICETLCRSQAG